MAKAKSNSKSASKKPASKSAAKPAAKKPTKKPAASKSTTAKKPVAAAKPTPKAVTKASAKSVAPAAKPTAAKPAATKPAAAKPAPTATGKAPQAAKPSRDKLWLDSDPRARHHAALEQKECVGDADLKPGFATSPEFDRLFALGWPHMNCLVDDEPAGFDAQKVLDTGFGMHLFGTDLPRAIAIKDMRLAVHHPSKPVRSRLPGTPAASLTDFGKSLAKIDQEPDLAEAKELLGMLTSRDYVDLWLWRKAGGILEALVGADVVVNAFIGALEKVPTATWREDESTIHDLVAALPSYRPRLTLAQAKAFDDRLAKLFKKVGGTSLAQRDPSDGFGWVPLRALDVVVNGKEGLLRSDWTTIHGAIPYERLPFLRNIDPEFMLGRLKLDDGPIQVEPSSARLFVLGPRFMAFEASVWDRYADPNVERARALFVDRYLPVAHPDLPKLFDAIAKGTTKSWAPAQKILKARR